MNLYVIKTRVDSDVVSYKDQVAVFDNLDRMLKHRDIIALKYGWPKHNWTIEHYFDLRIVKLNQEY